MTIRERIMAEEESILSPYAALSKDTEGREVEEADDDLRTPYMRDRDRIIHTKAFRRLKHKTQVFITPQNDHFRTRLTHTLEVNQIARTIGRALSLNTDLIEAIALGHDVGHTPFAHTGEKILDKLMVGGFRHNVNSIRVLKYIEKRSDGQRPLNLTKEVLDGILNHSGLGEAEENTPMTLEGQVVRLSDKIAYVQHDIDDAIRTGILRFGDLPQVEIALLGATHGQRIDTLVNSTITATQKRLSGKEVLKNKPLVAPEEEILKALFTLREFMRVTVFEGPLCTEERRRSYIVMEFLFDYYCKHPHKMPPLYIGLMDEFGKEQAVCDFISNMSDNYCIETFKDITLPVSMIGERF